MKKVLISAFLALSVGMAYADEGMWMLTDLKAQNEVVMREMGLDIAIEDIYTPNGISLKDAVVHFGRGCTGEIISSQGLLLTNHHCGYASIQQHSSVEHDYLTDGFWAMTHEDELPTPGLTVTFIDQILDVTDYVNEQLKIDGDPEGYKYLSPSYLATVAERFAKKENIQCSPSRTVELKAFYGGNKYYLFVNTIYSDIRMVGAPPSSIGKFGADTDNWMWPRHTGDFSLFRIYADKDGNPAPYSKNNVPLKVKKYLKISLGGLKEGDFVFVMGFPGRNWRYMIADEVEERMNTTNFARHYVRGARQEVLMAEMQKDPAVRIHYASKYAASANYWKNAIGMNEGLIRLKVLDTKRAQQEQLLARGRKMGDDSYQKAFEQIQSIVAKRHDALFHQQIINEALVTALDFMRIPPTAELVTALNSKDKKKIAEATQRLKEAGEKYFESVPYPEVERMVAKEMLKVYAQYIPEEQRISIFQVINSRRFKGDTDAFVDACFEHSIFGNQENFAKFIKKPTLYKIGHDWMILFKYSITDGLLKTAIAMKEANADYDAAHKVWVKGMMDMRREAGIPIYPDANSTLRLTYGKVSSYEPADGVVYEAHTTLKGVMEKEDPENWEFVVPQKLKELYQTKDYGPYGKNGEMPVCFIVNTDNTGGNSGSPVFNGKGQLVGTAFDRNYEGLTGDIAYRPSSQRASCVDIRYILFIIDKFAGAQRLIDELDIVE